MTTTISPPEASAVSMKTFCRKNETEVEELARAAVAENLEGIMSEILSSAIGGRRLSLDHIAELLEQKIVRLAESRGIIIE